MAFRLKTAQLPSSNFDLLPVERGVYNRFIYRWLKVMMSSAVRAALMMTGWMSGAGRLQRRDTTHQAQSISCV